MAVNINSQFPLMSSNTEVSQGLEVSWIKGGEHRERHQGEKSINMEGPQQPAEDLDFKSLKMSQNPDICSSY